MGVGLRSQLYPACPFLCSLWCRCMDMEGDYTGCEEQLMDDSHIFAEVSS